MISIVKDEKLLLTAKELAQFLCIKYDTLKTWLRVEQIPHIEINKRKYYRKQSILKWLDEKEQQSTNATKG